MRVIVVRAAFIVFSFSEGKIGQPQLRAAGELRKGALGCRKRHLPADVGAGGEVA